MEIREKQVVRVRVSFDRSELDGKLDDVICYLQKVSESVPVEFRHTIEIEVSGYDDYGSPSVEVDVFYVRPETDEEFETRKARHGAQQKAKLDAERATYEALKAKFGG